MIEGAIGTSRTFDTSRGDFGPLGSDTGLWSALDLSRLGDRGARASASGTTVLLADDEAAFRDAMRELLAELGFTVVGEAANGEEAVAMAEELHPDVLLMDLRMPVLDGIEAARRLRERLPTVPVVILSAYEDAGLFRGAQEAGVYCYLVKGCRAQMIRDVLLQASSFRRERERREEEEGWELEADEPFQPAPDARSETA